MSERFFLAAPPRDGRGILEGDEARHCSRVLRVKLGDVISVFDGRGSEWPARVAGIGRDAVTLDLGEPRPAEPATPIRLTLAVALPKGDRQKWLVEKSSELGVTRLVPLITERGVAEATDAARARLERAVIEACKQCGRNTLMEIAAPATVGELAARHPASLRLIAHPGGAPLGDQPIATSGRDVQEIVAAIGPEGGFTPEEFHLATAAGFLPVSLGAHILRVETAAIALAAWKRLSIA
ncbi:MAG: RsmE family RNA methyltransferase [Planctomycetia bacterium]